MAEAVADLLGSWVNGPADVVRDHLMDTLPDLANLYAPAAAALGADWYDEARAASPDAQGRFTAITVDPPETGLTDVLARWGTGPLFQAEPDMAAAQSLVAGGLQKITGDAHRGTIITSIARDPYALGWIRQTTGASCDFCVMLAGRGAVYSAETANFSSHNDCDCVALPKFGDPGNDAVKVLPYVPSQNYTDPAKRARNNANVRDYLNRNKPVTPGSRRTPEPVAPRDIDADRTAAQLRATLSSLERSLTLFDSPGTRARVADLRRKIAARS